MNNAEYILNNIKETKRYLAAMPEPRVLEEFYTKHLVDLKEELKVDMLEVKNWSEKSYSDTTGWTYLDYRIFHGDDNAHQYTVLYLGTYPTLTDAIQAAYDHLINSNSPEFGGIKP
jgi:hypothetical protein